MLSEKIFQHQDTKISFNKQLAESFLAHKLNKEHIF